MSDDREDVERWEAVEEATELLMEGEHLRALEHLRAVIEADPKNPYAYHFTGVAFDELGKDEAARDAFRAAVALAPNYLAARIGLSHALRKLGDVLQAVAEASEALRRFPEDGDVHYALALALIGADDYEGGRRHLEAFLASKPEVEASMEARAILETLDQAVARAND